MLRDRPDGSGADAGGAHRMDQSCCQGIRPLIDLHTSFVAPLLLPEAASAKVGRVLVALPAGDVVICQ
jgi:hypothetical protein